jgi:hypothetical protein
MLAGATAFVIGASMGVVIHHLRTAGTTTVSAAVHSTPAQPRTGALTPVPTATPQQSATPVPPPATDAPAPATPAAPMVMADPADTRSAAPPPPPPPAAAPTAPVTTDTTPPAAAPVPAATASAEAHPSTATSANGSAHRGDRPGGWDPFRHFFDRHDDDGNHPHH